MTIAPKFTRLEIPDLILIEPKTFADERGFFVEAYNEEDFHKNGITTKFVQDNQSRSKKGVIRGLHYQLPPRAQAKLIRVIKGEIFDVVVDIRKSSPTFGRSVVVSLSGENKKMLYIPAGFAHGLMVISDESYVVYKVSDAYSPENEGGIIWNDPALGISWPKLNTPYVLSPKDQKYPTLSKAAVFN
jgi:dTDP-4-dehydrorhamnose 3,5-epimerase